ncbi:MAG: orotidine-5'-phosphate decarboxylase [Pyrinomonadaceae bacterium]|nr:orotidine-5'-phosphate decarboxylase [Pyrinomonadaceae bacterium]
MSKDRLIFALDVSNAAEARRLVADLRNEVGAFKIGLQLFTSEGASFVREIVDGGSRVFLDVKFHDIPNTVASAAVEAARLGVWMFNIHASGGEKMMSLAVEKVREVCSKEGIEPPKLIAVTVLTSTDKKTLLESGIALDPEELVVKYALAAKRCGLDGVVASPLEAGAIRNAIDDPHYLVVTPGVRPDFATIDDQKRVTTPRQAIRNGSDFIVLGRPIRTADDPVKAARQIVEEMS